MSEYNRGFQDGIDARAARVPLEVHEGYERGKADGIAERNKEFDALADQHEQHGYERGVREERARCVAKIRAIAHGYVLEDQDDEANVAKHVADCIELEGTPLDPALDCSAAAESGAKDSGPAANADFRIAKIAFQAAKDRGWVGDDQTWWVLVESERMDWAYITGCVLREQELLAEPAPKPEKTGANSKCPRCDGLGILSFGHGTDDEICSSCYVRRDALPAPQPEKPRRKAKYWKVVHEGEPVMWLSKSGQPRKFFGEKPRIVRVVRKERA